MNVYSRPYFYQPIPRKTNQTSLTFGNQEPEKSVDEQTTALREEIFEIKPLRNTQQSIEEYLALLEKIRLFLVDDSIVCTRTPHDGLHKGIRIGEANNYAEIGYTFEQTQHSPWEEWETDIRQKTGNEQQAGRRPVFYIMIKKPDDSRPIKLADGKGLIAAADTLRNTELLKELTIDTLYQSDLIAPVIDHRRKPH